MAKGERHATEIFMKSSGCQRVCEGSPTRRNSCISIYSRTRDGPTTRRLRRRGRTVQRCVISGRPEASGPPDNLGVGHAVAAAITCRPELDAPGRSVTMRLEGVPVADEDPDQGDHRRHHPGLEQHPPPPRARRDRLPHFVLSFSLAILRSCQRTRNIDGGIFGLAVVVVPHARPSWPRDRAPARPTIRVVLGDASCIGSEPFGRRPLSSGASWRRREVRQRVA